MLMSVEAGHGTKLVQHVIWPGNNVVSCSHWKCFHQTQTLLFVHKNLVSVVETPIQTKNLNDLDNLHGLASLLTQPKQEKPTLTGLLKPLGMAVTPLHPTLRLCFLSRAATATQQVSSTPTQQRHVSERTKDRPAEEDAERAGKTKQGQVLLSQKREEAEEQFSLTDCETDIQRCCKTQQRNINRRVPVFFLLQAAITAHILTITLEATQSNPISEETPEPPGLLQRTMMLARLHFQMSVSHYSSADLRHSQAVVPNSTKQLICPTADPR